MLLFFLFLSSLPLDVAIPIPRPPPPRPPVVRRERLLLEMSLRVVEQHFDEFVIEIEKRNPDSRPIQVAVGPACRGYDMIFRVDRTTGHSLNSEPVGECYPNEVITIGAGKTQRRRLRVTLLPGRHEINAVYLFTGAPPPGSARFFVGEAHSRPIEVTVGVGF
jgi:hypothetical protein